MAKPSGASCNLSCTYCFYTEKEQLYGGPARFRMTPEVLDRLGKKLVDAAVHNRCGARFTGAGGGGCLWALGSAEDIDRLRRIWEEILQQRGEARLLEPRIDSTGLHLHS